jgi:hypothetical protein
VCHTHFKRFKAHEDEPSLATSTPPLSDE